MNIKGTLPLLILHILSNGPCHGYEISRHIREITNGVLDFKEGTLYPTLHKLDEANIIIGKEGQASGRRRRYYELSEIGRKRLLDEQAAWDAYVTAVGTVLASSHDC